MDEKQLQALLNPSPRVYFGPLSKNLNLAFTRLDEIALSRLLVARFEGLVFGGSFDVENGKEFRQVEGFHGPPDARERWAFVPPPDWDWSQVSWDGEGYLRGVPRTLVSYQYGTPEFRLDAEGRPRQPVSTVESVLRGYHYRIDPEWKALLRKVWRLVDSIAEREVKEIRQTGEVVDRARPHMTRFGYDALRWCQQDPERRLLKYYRPTDDWQMPESPWYEGLPGL